MGKQSNSSTGGNGGAGTVTVDPATYVPPDAYVISYPKSGRTWLKVQLGGYI